MDIKLGRIAKSDADLNNVICELVDVHIKSFQNFFLSFLGRRFLALFYKSLAREEGGIIIIAKLSDRIVSFVAGVEDQIAFYKVILKKYKWNFAIYSLPALLKKPSILPRLLRALKRPKEASIMSSRCCLMSICVHPDYQGLGLGKILIQEFCQELVKRGIISVCLTTDRDNNDNVNKFYQKLGFKLVRSFITNEGRPMNEYLKLLD